MNEFLVLTVASGLLLLLTIVIVSDLSKFPQTPHHMRSCSIVGETTTHTMHKCGKAVL